MFGYVMADADRLSDKDAARYRAAYCGVSGEWRREENASLFMRI